MHVAAIIVVATVYFQRTVNAERYTTKPAGYTLYDPPNNERTYSDIWSNVAVGASACARSQLGSAPSNDAWCTRVNDGASTNSWMQFDMQEVKSLGGVVTRARHASQWVTKYMVSYSVDGTNWAEVPMAGHFTGNTDNTAFVYNTFAGDYKARYVRIYPKGYQVHTSMAAALLIPYFECKGITGLGMASDLGLSEEDFCELVGTYAFGCVNHCDSFTNTTPDPMGACTCDSMADSDALECISPDYLDFCDEVDDQGNPTAYNIYMNEICPKECCYIRD